MGWGYQVDLNQYVLPECFQAGFTNLRPLAEMDNTVIACLSDFCDNGD